MSQMNCPKGHGVMQQKEIERTVPFKGIDIIIFETAFLCPVCGLSAGTIESAGKIQKAIADAYRKQAGFLSGEEIRVLRKSKGMTQNELAVSMNVGIASIKRWETGAIQSKSMDQALRQQLINDPDIDDISGNRQFSIPRVLLVALAFKAALGRTILKKNDKMLFAAKYLWYADMFAYKMLGRSMTGATYANLPYGPQLNNYKDLLDEIRKSDVSETENLTDSELDIISEIAQKFPEDRMVYDAAHKEPAWLQTTTGELISYSWANKIEDQLKEKGSSRKRR
jgi:putative zinc finger/helix-turn-helix YgiT family protein